MSKITLSKLYEMKKSGEKIVMITAYDALFAKIFDGEVDMVLVGDSLNMSFGGHSETLGASVEQMIYHARVYGRGYAVLLVRDARARATKLRQSL